MNFFNNYEEFTKKTKTTTTAATLKNYPNFEHTEIIIYIQNRIIKQDQVKETNTGNKKLKEDDEEKIEKLDSIELKNVSFSYS